MPTVLLSKFAYFLLEQVGALEILFDFLASLLSFGFFSICPVILSYHR